MAKRVFRPSTIRSSKNIGGGHAKKRSITWLIYSLIHLSFVLDRQKPAAAREQTQEKHPSRQTTLISSPVRRRVVAVPRSAPVSRRLRDAAGREQDVPAGDTVRTIEERDPGARIVHSFHPEERGVNTTRCVEDVILSDQRRIDIKRRNRRPTAGWSSG